MSDAAQPTSIPRAALATALEERIAGRKVRAAVFTTFRFDPGFFEEHVLATLTDRVLSHAPSIRLVQLQEALREVDEVAVYYDVQGLVAGCQPARLDVQRLPCAGPQGYFHPKLVLVLVDPPTEADATDRGSLIVGVLSANLTRAGWWENVECGDVRELRAGEPCTFRDDLLGALGAVAASERSGAPQRALERIRSFVEEAIPAPARRGLPRLFWGQTDFPTFLREVLPPNLGRCTLEVVSPYFEVGDRPTALEGLIAALSPRETLVYLPCDERGKALCREPFHAAVAALDAVRWARLPREVVRRGRSRGPREQPDRFVHAKVYRLHDAERRREVVVVGSVNLTQAAHGHAGAGNLEVALVIAPPSADGPRPWLEALRKDETPVVFLADGEDAEPEALDDAVLPVAVRFDWASRTGAILWYGTPASRPAWLDASSLGAPLGRWSPGEGWRPLPPAACEQLAGVLVTTSFVDLARPDGARARVLVQEVAMLHKPPLFQQLSVEDILRYWSLLSAEQRAAFLEEKGHELMASAGLAASREASPEAAGDDLFGRFAGVFHAFHCLAQQVERALGSDRFNEADYRLLGRQHDSLPTLVDRLDDAGVDDAVLGYVTLLTAEDTLTKVAARHPRYATARAAELTALRERLSVLAARAAGRLQLGAEGERFLAWFRRQFAAPAERPA